jgi:hypothetical protein
MNQKSMEKGGEGSSSGGLSFFKERESACLHSVMLRDKKRREGLWINEG